MKRILITGAGGFIGSHLAELCVRKGYSVKAFIHYNSRNSWGWLENSPVKDALEILTGDIRDFDSVVRAVRNVDTVLHLAALIGIPYSYESPAAYIQTNVSGTYNVLESARTLNLENVVITSTSETYGTAQSVPIDENHLLRGQSPYSASKIGADQLALSYHFSFGLPVKIARPFNVYGPRQSARAVIPTIITQILNAIKRIKIGSPEPTRDLTYVKDTVKGILAIAESDHAAGEIINIGMNKEISVGDLARMIADIIGAEIILESVEERIRPEKSEVERLVCDNRKIKKLTGWVPDYSLESGLAETIDWFRDHLSLYKHEIYNI